MITVEQAASGLTRYLDAEVMPHLPSGRGLLLGAAAALYIRKGPEIVRRLADIPAVKLLGVIDAQGCIDLDELYNAALPQVKSTFDVQLPFVGGLTFDRAEVEKIYRYLKGEM